MSDSFMIMIYWKSCSRKIRCSETLSPSTSLRSTSKSWNSSKAKTQVFSVAFPLFVMRRMANT